MNQDANLDELLAVLRAFIQEWGGESVFIQLPENWVEACIELNYQDTDLFSFSTEDEIVITACDGNSVVAKHALEAKEMLDSFKSVLAGSQNQVIG